MKKMIFSMMLMMSTTLAFAGNEENETVNTAYEFNVNMEKLSYALGLNSDQYFFVADVMDAFKDDMMTVAYAPAEDRKGLMDQVIKRNLSAARTLMTTKQYHKYLMLLNATINNRGLNK